MSSSDGTLPFPEILLLVGYRSGDGESGTDRDLLSVQLQRLFLASVRPILEQPKPTNHLPFKYLPSLHDISPRALTGGAKIYSFWVGFLVRGTPELARAPMLQPVALAEPDS